VPYALLGMSDYALMWCLGKCEGHSLSPARSSLDKAACSRSDRAGSDQDGSVPEGQLR
jgi:hypothetical protein